MAIENYPKIYLYRRVVQAKLFIDEHYHEPVNLAIISGKAYFSEYHFIRLFNKIYGQTPHQYLINVRILNARKLLQANMPVTMVCYAVGFTSIGSFTTLFKKHTSLTPADFRAQYLLRAKHINSEPLNFIPNCFSEQCGWREKSNFQEA